MTLRNSSFKRPERPAHVRTPAVPIPLDQRRGVIARCDGMAERANIEVESWMPVVDYEGYYEVSSFGRVRSLDRTVRSAPGRTRLRRGKVLKYRIDSASAGYSYVNLSREGVARKRNVHALVLEAFVGPRPTPGHQACHANGDRTDARLTNLRWDTPIGNASDKDLHGTHGRGERSATAKLSEADVEAILQSPLSSIKLGESIGVASSTVRAVRLGQNWSSSTGISRPKSAAPVRDESYRRLVAALPCFVCHVEGRSQAAHPNTGKAKGRKLSDHLCFPLCCDQLGAPGHHWLFDQYRLVPKADMPDFERRAYHWTVRELLARGLWPARLPIPDLRTLNRPTPAACRTTLERL